MIITTQGEQALRAHEHAKRQRCPTCDAAPGEPCYTKKKGTSKDLARMLLAGKLPFKQRATMHRRRYA